MPLPTTRQAVFAGLAAVSLAALTGCSTSDGTAAPAQPTPSVGATGANGATDPEFAHLEEEFDARLGVYALDTGTDEVVEYHADERFAYCSTFKVLAFGAVLQQTSVDELDRVITYTEDDLVNYTPITEQHVDTGMSLLEIGDAALRYSDNTAANLLLAELGGPDGLDEALEAIGDDVTHVDRIEPELSEAVPGDVRDTSTPRAMATSLSDFTLGDALPEDKREIIIEMMQGNMTGDELIRAGVPDDWEVGDKTGSGGYGTRNDIAVLWPPEGRPHRPSGHVQPRPRGRRIRQRPHRGGRRSDSRDARLGGRGDGAGPGPRTGAHNLRPVPAPRAGTGHVRPASSEEHGEHQSLVEGLKAVCECGIHRS